MLTMLILTEQSLTPHDVERIAGLHEGPVTAHVVVPAGTDQSTLDQLVDGFARAEFAEHDARPSSAAELVRIAQTRVDDSVARLLATGMAATGVLAPDHPVAAVAALADQHRVDEIIVVTEPHLVSDVLRRDWATRLRHSSSRPVLHFIAGTDQVVN